MKKLILVLVIFAVITGSASAGFNILSFPPPLEDGGAFMIDVGMGLRSWSLLKMVMPPLFLNFEYALPVGVPISVGGGIAVGIWRDNYYWSSSNNYAYRITYLTPYVRANWHWGLDVKWLDLYTGLSFGADIAIVKWSNNIYANSRLYTAPGSLFFYAFQGGAHFYFTKNVGVVVETGYPYYLKAGLALKFGGKGGGSGSSE